MSLEGGPTQEKIPDISDFGFDDINFFKKGEKQTLHYKAAFQGVPMELFIENSCNTFTDPRSITREQNFTVFTFYTSKEEGYSAKLVLQITDNEGEYLAGTNVSNYKREMKGFGRELWQISNKLIQKAANELNKPITHDVTKAPFAKLPSEKWDELFKPILEKNGYTSDEDQEWSKIYYPIKVE